MVGTGTRCELTRSTSSEGIALSLVLALDDGCGITGGGGIVLVLCRGRSCAGVAPGLALALRFFCRPDWEWVVLTSSEQANASVANPIKVI